MSGYRNRSIGTLVPMFLILCVATAVLAAAPRRPNIVFILADDLGWSDTTLYGTTRFYQTPNVERLARQGMTFTRAYSASPLCSPTRASIMTGLSPARIGITAPVCHLKQVVLAPTVPERGPPAETTIACKSATRLKTEYYTLAEALHDAGYATGHFGKWHLGAEPYDPLHQGFMVDVPHWPGPGPAGSYVAPWRFPKFQPRTPHEHIEDRMGDEAVAFIRQHQNEPFFLNYWQFSVHAPFDAKPEYIARNRKRVDPTNPQRSPTYASMVESLDDNIGKMLDELARLKLLEKTIIIFFSDNGGNMYNEIDGTTPTSNLPLRGGKATMYEGGIRVPCVIRWPRVTAPGSRSDQVIQSVDFYPTILAMLNLAPQPNQQFDGISIVLALHGKPLQRDMIFTYFPHAPKVPDWLPPAVAVHCGDWKLIRVFFGDEGRDHAYRLYNVKDDIGERTNLADKYPARVRQLDQAIDRFLRDTGAVLPRRNPDYNPAVVALRQYGITGVNGCDVSIDNGRLNVSAKTGDPHFTLTLPNPLPPGRFTVQLHMQSKARGDAHVYWQEKGVKPVFAKQRRTAVPITYDGKFHDYSAVITPTKPLVAIRLDPADHPGSFEIERVQLCNADGKTCHQWTFRDP